MLVLRASSRVIRAPWELNCHGWASKEAVIGIGIQLLFVQVVVLVVLRTLQGQLKGEAILGDLVDPYSRGNFGRSRVSSALLARFSGSVRLP